MQERHLTAIVCDDVRIEMTQKLVMIGVYPGHIVIQQDPLTIQQLVFFLIFESDINDPFILSAVEILLPEQSPIRFELPAQPYNPEPRPEFTQWVAKLHIAIQAPSLTPGKIKVKAIHDKGETDASGPWIILAAALSQGKNSDITQPT